LFFGRLASHFRLGIGGLALPVQRLDRQHPELVDHGLSVCGDLFRPFQRGVALGDCSGHVGRYLCRLRLRSSCLGAGLRDVAVGPGRFCS